MFCLLETKLQTFKDLRSNAKNPKVNKKKAQAKVFMLWPRGGWIKFATGLSTKISIVKKVYVRVIKLFFC